MGTIPKFDYDVKVITAMVTPFCANDIQSVDLENVVLLANYLVNNGTDSLLLNGSTGEASQLSEDERWHIVDTIRKSTPYGTRIIVSTGDTNTKRAIMKTEKAFKLGANAALVVVPEYIKPPQQAMYAHFNAIAKSVSDKPIIIYNVPSRTGSEILPETVAKLNYDNPNIIGIKQSMPNLDRVSELKLMCPENFQIYSGDDSLTLPMLSLGAKGVISVASHLEGETIRNMIIAFRKGENKLAMQYHQLLFPLYKALFMTTNPMPIKEALYQRHLINSPVLRTLGEMNTTEKENLKKALSTFEYHKQNMNMKLH